MSKKLSIVFLLLLSCCSLVTAQKNTTRVQAGVYMGYHLDSEHPDWGYYSLKKDSTFVLIGIAKDSIVTHVAKGKWYMKGDNVLGMQYAVCPVKSLPEVQVSYNASNLPGFDSVRLEFTILDKNKDTIPAAFIYLDGVQHVQQTKFEGSLDQARFKKAIVLPKTALPQKIVIAPVDNMVPFFHETAIRPLEGFNEHKITLRSLHKDADHFFQPFKDGEAKMMSFQKKYSSGSSATLIDFGGFKLEHKNISEIELANILKEATRKQPEYKDYFLWALASL